MSIKVNERGLIQLNEQTMTAIFECVYGMPEDGYLDMNRLFREKKFMDFLKALKGLQEFNYLYRFDQTAELFPLFEATVGPMERNSEGTTLWLAMGLAIKELYGMRRSTLEELLRKVKVRK